ncbi:MAG: nicotinamide mononucleotide transporter [Bacteroidia bacterium]|nr:nicotinamide mononucleotide transporter [Bacteroidia bacterium]MBP9688235.1 nicotinamide mononucleotide transporter [Bacteroidia bacterium]
MTINQILEIGGAGFSIICSLLLMREKTIGWWFGIASSIIGVVLFYHTKLYAQSIISIYYVGVGVYGLWYWKKAEIKNEHIAVWKPLTHVYTIIIFTGLSLACSYLFKNYTDSASPYLDSFITLFGLLASIKEARKILSSWVYWFVINAGSVLLYYQQSMYYYAVLMVVYTLICIGGFISWYKIYKAHSISEMSLRGN